MFLPPIGLVFIPSAMRDDSYFPARKTVLLGKSFVDPDRNGDFSCVPAQESSADCHVEYVVLYCEDTNADKTPRKVLA